MGQNNRKKRRLNRAMQARTICTCLHGHAPLFYILQPFFLFPCFSPSLLLPSHLSTTITRTNNRYTMDNRMGPKWHCVCRLGLRYVSFFGFFFFLYTYIIYLTKFLFVLGTMTNGRQTAAVWRGGELSANNMSRVICTLGRLFFFFFSYITSN